MKIRPVSAATADPRVAEAYRTIAAALEVPHVPLFFQYIGAFPNYLLYITDSIVKNVSHPKFKQFVKEHNNFANEVFRENFAGTREMYEYINRYEGSPDVYNFKALEAPRIQRVNASIMLVFLALREAVKGWAIAAKKLPGEGAGSSIGETVNDSAKEELLYGDIVSFTQTAGETVTQEPHYDERAVTVPGGLVKRQSNSIAQAFLPEYLVLCKKGFSQMLKRQDFLFFRVNAEKVVLRTLEFLPEKVFSPINIVLPLIKDYPHFPDLLYMLSEHFPTYAVQRWLFSGYMQVVQK